MFTDALADTKSNVPLKKTEEKKTNSRRKTKARPSATISRPEDVSPEPDNEAISKPDNVSPSTHNATISRSDDVSNGLDQKNLAPFDRVLNLANETLAMIDQKLKEKKAKSDSPNSGNKESPEECVVTPGPSKINIDDNGGENSAFKNMPKLQLKDSTSRPRFAHLNIIYVDFHHWQKFQNV